MIKYTICETCSRKIYSKDELCWTCLGWDESWASWTSFPDDSSHQEPISVFQFIEFTFKCILASFAMMLVVGIFMTLFSLPFYGFAIGIIIMFSFIHLVLKDYYGSFHKRLFFFSIEFLRNTFYYDYLLEKTKSFTLYIQKNFLQKYF